MTIKYTVVETDENGEEISSIPNLTIHAAMKKAKNECANTKNNIIVVFNNALDINNFGYLNRCGDHEITGKNWNI